MRKKKSPMRGSNPRPSTLQPTTYHLKVEFRKVECAYHVSITNLDFDDLIVAAHACLLRLLP